MSTGARAGSWNWLRGITARALARDLQALVLPGPEVARACGLDVPGAGMQIASNPRHASVLLVVGELPPGLRDAAVVAYAQMPRPRIVIALSAGNLSPLPDADVTGTPDQAGLLSAVNQAREHISERGWSESAASFEAGPLRSKTEYTCPMHPEMVQDEPGTCPKCGMELVPRESGAEDMEGEGAGAHTHHHREEDADSEQEPHEAGETYVCPMHPDVVQDEPGKCPRCSMDLVPKESEGASHGEHRSHDMGIQEQIYTCPMHPEVTQDHPGKCPRCGMALEPQQKEGERGQGHASVDHDQMQHDGGQHEGMGHEGMSHGNMDHGDMEHGDGFMSMVSMTQDLPRSPDGLPMEWVEAPFGPIFRGLPGGLGLTLTLDGDSVAKAEVRRGSVFRNLESAWLEPVDAFPNALARLDPLSPVAYRLLGLRGLENTAGIEPDEAQLRARIFALERERAASHLNWLVEFAYLLGDDWLSHAASKLHARVLRAASVQQIAEIREDLTSFIRKLESSKSIRIRLEGVGGLEPDIDNMRGPVARASGLSLDERANEAIYTSLGFATITEAGGDALARLRVRLAETAQSLDLLISLGAGQAGTENVGAVPKNMGGHPGQTRRSLIITDIFAATQEVWDKGQALRRGSGRGTARRAPTTSAQGQHIPAPTDLRAMTRQRPAPTDTLGSAGIWGSTDDDRGSSELVRRLSGDSTGLATLETPRGAAILQVRVERGRVTHVSLETPSTGHMQLIGPVAKGRELSDALLGVASLDVSPWEVDR